MINPRFANPFNPDPTYPLAMGTLPGFPTMTAVADTGSQGLENAVRSLPDFLYHRTHAVASKRDVDPGMALSTLLASMAAAVHGSFTVQRPEGDIEPLALFFMVLAGRTTGKTRTHKLVHKAHNAEDVHRYLVYEGVDAIEDLEVIQTPPDTKAARPRQRLRPILQQDATQRGLLESLRGVGESATISAHEGHSVLSTPLFRRELDLLNRLYDGDEKVMLTRAERSTVMAFNSSLNILVMVQPTLFNTYLRDYGEAARELGFLARCLFTAVPPGKVRLAACADADRYLSEHDRQVQGFLEAQRVDPGARPADREVLSFSPEACELWWELQREHEQLTHSAYWHVQDAANRAMQNVARLAGVIHCYADTDGPIDREVLHAAWMIVNWHMTQFASLFPPVPPPAPKPRQLSAREKRLEREMDDVNLILEHIAGLCSMLNEPAVLRSKVLIRSGLYAARFRTALMRLVDEGRVLESGSGKQVRLSLVPQGPLAWQGGQGWL